MLPEEKPAINLNFTDPSVKKLTLFIQSISEKFKDEPNLPITVKVLECLIFIKLNFPWISYAILHKEKDNTIYTYAQDRAKRVLRAHNDMSFHIIMYEEPEKAISDYQSIITAIEDKIDLLLENSAYSKTFIRKIQDSAVGCMEARLELALNYIIDPSIPKLDDIFQDFFAEQTQLGIASEDIDKFIPHLTKYFANKIGEELTHAGKTLTLSWSEVKDYLENFFGYDEELKPFNLFKDAIITQKGNNYLLNFPNQKIAEKYLNLIRISLPNDLYFPLKKTNIINSFRTNSFFYYNFQLNQEQFHIITILLEESVNHVVSQNEPHSLIPVLQTALTNSFAAVKSTIHQYPTLKNFIINNDGETLVHYFVKKNQLEPLKILIKTYQLDINAQIDRPNTYTHGMTSVFLACYLASISHEILEYLLQAGADVNIPNSKGVMPLEQLAFSSNQEKLKVLLTYRKEPKGDMSLLYAIGKNSIEVVQQILSIPGININYKNTEGESALFLAAKNGDIQKLTLLLAFEDIDLETSNKTGKTAIQIARDNGHQQASELIYTQLKSTLETKASLAVRQDHSFANYALTLHKVPTEDLYISYLKDLITFNTTQDKVNAVTQKEAHSVLSRKLWSDVVSETYLANQQYCQENTVKEQVIQRIKALNVRYPLKTYQDCMTYIREDSVITLSFDAAFLKKGLVDLQPLNVWQRDNKTSSYKTNRDAAERGMFSFLSDSLRTALFDNKEARPRYAACWLPDKNTTRPHAAAYGNSFLVLKDVIKLNSIFSPGNPLGFKSANKKDYKVCTIHDLDLLLLQCQPATLQAIVNKVTNGELKADNYDQNVIWQKDKGGHFEAMIPTFDFLNPYFVAHIHIDPNGYVLSSEEKAFIESLGIKVSNSLVAPYEELGKKFTHAKGNADHLLEQYPLLRKIFVQPKLPNHLLKLKELLEKLNDFASKEDFKQFNATWNQLRETGLIKAVTRNISDYFNDFANSPLESVFTKLLEEKDETLAKLFIDSKLVHMGNLLNDFLYPKQGSSKNSLFYKYISYGVENKNASFLNLLFSQIPESQRDDFMELFKTECIDYLEKSDPLLALKLLVFLKQENYLDLKQGMITPESNLILQAEYVIHILYSLMHGEALSPLHIDFLEKCPIVLLSNLLQILLHQHTLAEASNLINADLLRKKFTELCEKNDQIFYAIHLEKTILNYQKQLETLALAGSFADFKENWEKVIDLNQQYTKQINKNFYWVANTIFKSAIKGCNTQIVRLMLENYLVDIYCLHKNIGNKNSTEPLGYFNAISLAVYANDLLMLNVLCETSTNLDFYSKQQTARVMQNPLAIAISNDNRDMVNLLLEKKITIFHQEENFYESAIWTAMTMDFKYNKEFAYYFNLLVNKMTEQSKSEFLEKFTAEYLPGLTANYTDEAGWILNLLLKKDYLNIDHLLRNNVFFNSSVFCPILLEKIIHLNKPSAYQIKFLKKNKVNLNKLVSQGMDLNLFSSIELEQLSKQSPFFSLLNEALQKKIIEIFKIDQCKHRALTLSLVKEIINFTDTQLEQTKKSPLYREKALKYHIFYKEIKSFITQVDLRFKEKKVNDDTELDFAEIQTLAVILEDSQQTTSKEEESWYFFPFQLAIKQFFNLPFLNVLSKNNLPLSIDKLSTLNEIIQKAIEKYRAYRLVMWPAIEKHIKQFPLDESDQVLDFILPRVAGMLYRDIDTTTGTLIQKVLHRTEIENYLQSLFSFNEDTSFILAPEEPTADFFSENFIEVDPIECGPVVTEPEARDPRLNSTLLENLLLSYIEGPASKKYQISQGMIEIIGKYNIHTYYKKLHQADNVPIFVFQVARDSKKEEQSMNLPFINDVITSYITQNSKQDVKLLIPMAQCRSQLGRRKQHYVLVEITIKDEKLDIVIHNSKSASSSFAYPNCLKDLKYNSIKNSHYSQQRDDISCGFYVYNYIKSILETGNSNELPNICVTLQAMISNPSLLKDLLNDNFTQMKSDAREIREIGESFPWERGLLKEMLNKDYEEKLKYLSEMIGKQEEEKTPNNKSDSAHSSLSSTSSFFKKNLPVSTLRTSPEGTPSSTP